MRREAEKIDQTAATWLSRSERGLSAAEEIDLAGWLEADARHAESYNTLRQSWTRLDRLRGSRLADQLEAELRNLEPPTRRQSRSVARVSWFPVQPWVSGALAACLVAVLAYVAWLPLVRESGSYAETSATEVGAVRMMNLPDGSVVRLNTNTAIEVLFTKTERRVRLGRGEAFFTIAKNPARPFIVTAAGVDVRAVGTEFNVRLHEEAVEVLVREGKVRVEDASNGASLLTAPPEAVAPSADPHPILSAGHRVVIPVAAAPKPAATATAPEVVANTEIERSLAWQSRRLVFESASLATIVAEFNRYNQHQMVIADAELAARQFGGTFNANDPRTLTELLQSSYDVVLEDRGDQTVLRVQR